MSNDLDLGDLKITIRTQDDEPVSAKFELPDGSIVTRPFPATGELTMKLGLGLGLQHQGGGGGGPVAPTNLVLPAISGDAISGQTLSVSDGTWDDGGAAISGYTYQWKDDGVDIGGATANTFLLTDTQIGGAITCTVTATNAAGSTPATSAATDPVTGAPHRYWRINVTANGSGNVTVIGEVEMYESEFGPNVCTGGTASADSEFSGFYDAANAFDGNVIDTANPGWGSTNTSLPHWLRYDFGAGNEKDINAIGMFARNDNTSVAETSPTAFDVQYSDDGTNWTTKWSESGLSSWSNREFRRFVDPAYQSESYSGSPWGSHSYWRAVLFDGSVVVVSEVEFRATPGGADQTTGGSATASSEFNGTFAVANAFDGNTATHWACANGAAAGWVRYNFASPVSVGQMAIRARTDAASGFPTAFHVQFADASGGPWTTTFQDLSESGWSQSEQRTYTDPAYV